MVHTQQNIDQESLIRQRLEFLLHPVEAAVNYIRQLTPAQCTDLDFLEKEFVPALGLNNENLHEQPKELTPFFGTGLHLWQYPIQFASYLLWLKEQAPFIKKYVEIGCRWGGTLIVVSEWLKKNGAPLELILAIDPIPPSSFIKEYRKRIEDEKTCRFQYIEDLSTSPESILMLKEHGTDLVFIDGDHSLRGALTDHMNVREHAKWIVHHDITSDACPDTRFLWSSLKELEKDRFNSYEFTKQYPSVNGQFLGIGVLKRK